ncbi:MAG: DnaD domain protein [Oscillospiraceae bacterium]|nr:DnaD domain protein [Oscillospiraceae bacterium]
MNYKINWNGSDGVFAVPDLAADCLKLASGKAVKLLLYILKNKTSDETLAEMGKAVGITEEDAEDAISYWQQVGVILSDGGLSPVSQVMTADTSHAAVKAVPEVSAPRAREKAAKMISPSEISERVESSEEIKFLFSAAEATLGKVLTYTEQRTLIWLHDYYGTASDLLLMIMDFAVSQNKANIGFIEKVASGWHESGIITHEQAEREILRMQNYYSLSGQVCARLGLERTLTPTERKFVSDWAAKNIDIDLIAYAYEKTVDAIGKVKFSYMNKILLDWYGKGFFTPADVKKSEKKPAAADKVQKSGGEHSYNLDLLVEHAMNTVPEFK